MDQRGRATKGIKPLDSLVITHWGGSRNRWGRTFTLAWRGGRFVVAGVDTYEEDILQPGTRVDTSTNFLTGQTRIDRGGKVGALRPVTQKPFPAEDCTRVAARLGDAMR